MSESNTLKQSNKLWDKLFPWERGDRVKVVDPKSLYFGKVGTVYNFFTAYPTFDCGVGFDNPKHGYAYFKKEALERIPNEEEDC